MDPVALGSHYASWPLEPLAGVARRGVCAAMQTWVRPDPGSARPVPKSAAPPQSPAQSSRPDRVHELVG